MKKSIGRNISILNHLFSKQLNKLLLCNNTCITTDQFRLLTFLWDKDGIAQQELVDMIGRDKSAITRMVDLLENSGFVTRILDKTDKRVNLIYLTKKGKQLKFSAFYCAQTCNEIALKNFTEDESIELERLLLKSIRNFNIG